MRGSTLAGGMRCGVPTTRSMPRRCFSGSAIQTKGIAKPGAANTFVHHLAHHRSAQARVQPQRVQAGLEAGQVVVEAEEPALPDMRDVVGGVTVQEAPVEDRDLRILGGDEFTVDKCAALHGNRSPRATM